MVQLFDIDRQTAGETIVHAVALVPVVSEDHFLLEDDEGELAHDSNAMTHMQGSSEDQAEQGSEPRKMGEEDDSPSETTASATATTTLPSRATDAFSPSLYPTSCRRKPRR